MGRSRDAQIKDIHPSTNALSISVAPDKLSAGAIDAMVRIMALVLETCVLPILSARAFASGVVVAQTSSAEESSTLNKGRPAANAVAMT